MSLRIRSLQSYTCNGCNVVFEGYDEISNHVRSCPSSVSSTSQAIPQQADNDTVMREADPEEENPVGSGNSKFSIL